MVLSPSNLRLVKIASIGGLFVSISGYYMKRKVDEKLRSSDYYLKAVAHVNAYRPLLEYLGEPVSFGNANLSDTSRNYTLNDTEAVFEIPIIGKHRKGAMHFKAVRTPEEPPATSNLPEQPVKLSWKVVQLEVSINGRPGERVLVPIKPLTVLVPPLKSSNIGPPTTPLETQNVGKLTLDGTTPQANASIV